VKQSHLIGNTSFLKKPFLILGSLFLLVGSWLYLYYLQTEKKITLYTNQIKKLETEKNQLFAKKASNRTIKKTTQHLEKRLHETSKHLAKKRKNPSERIASIARKIQKLGLTLNSCTTKQEKRKTWFTKQNVTYSLSGKIEPIGQLVKAISKKGKNLKCKKFFLATMPNKKIEVELVLQFLTFRKNLVGKNLITEIKKKPFNFEKS